MTYKIVLFYLIGFVCFRANGLKCYSCTLTVAEGEEKPDLTCVNNPSSLGGRYIITCPARMKFCTTIRHDYVSTDGVSSFERNCAESPIIMDGDIVSDELISHYRTCTTDLCNKGNGLESISNGNQGEGLGDIVPGKASDAVSITTTNFILVSFLIILKLC